MFNSTLEQYTKTPAVPDGSADAAATAADSEADIKEMLITDQVLADNKERTNRNLRTRDLILERSKSAALIVT